ncbi:hypothetical protein INT45_010696 [Circinella minor]|uniref:Uncharacterized protein n=1 Tax=Circinella minor TaxID=1195481 RepID=A0A8H7VLJ7_9FUNG|nr:hypothetical protein INT45_010696 [Circinella minor]
MQVASPIIHPHHSADNLPLSPPSSQEKSMDDSTSPIDVSQHLTSLKTRLDFACFKLHHGWQSNTLIDVELMWKRKQRQMYSEIPTPRVTQQDILDKRTQVPSARTSKAKRARLTRTMSAPSPPPAHHTYKKRKSHQQPLLLSQPHYHQQQQQQQPGEYTPKAVEIRPRLIQPRPPRDPYRFYQHPHDKEQQQHGEDERQEREDEVLLQKRQRIDNNGVEDDEEEEVDELSQESGVDVEMDDERQEMEKIMIEQEHQHQQRQSEQPEQPKSSLDFLSYAIAMKEGDHHVEPAASSSSSQPQPDISNIEPNAFDDDRDSQQEQSQHGAVLRRPDWDSRTQKKPSSAFHSVTNDDRFSGGETESDEPSPPSSPVAAAAHAIMMFVHDHYSRNNKSPVYHNNNNH